MENASKQRTLRAALEEAGWNVTQTTVQVNHRSGKPNDCPAWKLCSFWPPTELAIYLEVHRDRIVAPHSWTVPNKLSFGKHFDRELPAFINGLNSRRDEQSVGCTGTFTILGVEVGNSKTQIDAFHGTPHQVATYYIQAFVPPRSNFEFERVQCAYDSLTVNYYQSETELLASQLLGTQLELKGEPYLFAGEQIHDGHEIFAREAEYRSPAPVHHLGPSNGRILPGALAPSKQIKICESLNSGWARTEEQGAEELSPPPTKLTRPKMDHEVVPLPSWAKIIGSDAIP